jgi:hypothetical protein
VLAPALSVKITIPELFEFNRDNDVGENVRLSDEFVIKEGRLNEIVISYPSSSVIGGRV